MTSTRPAVAITSANRWAGLARWCVEMLIADSENITFDIWVKSNQISELQVDLAQFLPSDQTGGGHLPIDAKFSQSAGNVSAPSDVTNIDVQKLLSAFGSGL